MTEENTVNLNRRTFVGMSIAAAAATKVMAKAPKPTIDPLKAPRNRFWVAALSPLNSRGDFDNGANDAMLAAWKEAGADGVLLLGTTGAGQSFSVAERKRILENASRNKHGLDFIVGTGTANIAETIELSKHAADNGADSVLIVPPYYEKNPKGEGVVAYFDQVFAQIKTPVRYYHIPRTTGVPVDASVFKALTKYPNFVGVKDSNGDAAEYEKIVAAAPGLNVLTGTDNLLEASLGHGNGCILASGNIYAKYIAEVFKANRAGQDIKPALARLQGAQSAYRTAMGAQAGGGGGGEAVNKYALSKFLGIDCAYVRPPAVPVADDLKPKIQAAIEHLKTYA
jgi:4-hydroxy-tetrahydrodipicolinate synthase